MNLLHHHPQCPKCELKFANRHELQWHLREDHPAPSAATSSPMTIVVDRPKPAEAPSGGGGARRLWAWLRPGRRGG